MESTKKFIRRDPQRKDAKVIGQARTEYGTRMSHRITCCKCQQVDHVAIRSNKTNGSMCRSCAEKFLATYDYGRHIEPEKISRRCDRCRQDFLVKESIGKEKEILLCFDCMRGFDVWRGKVGGDRAHENHHKSRLIPTRMGALTTFRKSR